MLEQLKRHRELLSIVIIVAIAVGIVVAVTERVIAWMGSHDTFGEMRALGGTALGLAPLLLMILAVAACSLVRPTTRHSPQIAYAGFVVALLGFLTALICLVGGLIGQQGEAIFAVFEALGGLTDLVLKGVAAYAMRWMSRIARESIELGQGEVSAPAVEAAAAVPTTVPRDAAAGVRWRSAAEAAHAAPAAASQPETAAAGPAATAHASLWDRKKS